MPPSQDENDPLLRGAARPGTGETQGEDDGVRYRTSVQALTSLSNDGLVGFDDPAGTYHRQTGRGSDRATIIDDELQVRDDSLDISKSRRNHMLGNVLKIVLIVITVGIYTFGPILNNWGQRIPGVLFNYEGEGTAPSDFFEFGTTYDKKQRFERNKNNAKEVKFISEEDFDKAKKEVTDDGKKTMDDSKINNEVGKLQYRQLYDQAFETGEAVPRVWTNRWDRQIGGTYGLSICGQGAYSAEIVLGDVNEAGKFTARTEGSQKVTMDPNEKKCSAPVVPADSSGAVFSQITIQFTDEPGKTPGAKDYLQFAWYKGSEAPDAQQMLDDGRTVKLWKYSGAEERKKIDEILASNEKTWLDTQGENPSGEVYNPLVVIFLYKCVSITLAFLLSFYVAFKHKKEDKFIYLKQCFNLKNVLLFSPASVGWVLGDLAEMIASGSLDPAFYAVVTQLRLVLTAVLALFLLKKGQNTLQWIMLASLTFTVVAFKLSDSGDGGGMPFVPVVMVFVKVAISVFCGVWSEKALKDIKQPFPVQIANILVVSVPFTAVALYPFGLMNLKPSLEILKYGWFGGPDFGFDMRTWIVLFFYIAREWLTNLCVKRFSAVVKNICNSIAPLVTYILQVMVFQNKIFQLFKLFLFFVVTAEVTNWSLAKAYKKEEDPKAAELPTTQKEDDEQEVNNKGFIEEQKPTPNRLTPPRK